MEDIKRQKLEDVANSLDNTKIAYFENLITPKELKQKLPTNASNNFFIYNSRATIRNIIHGKDKRKLLIVGPCSIHNVEEAKLYARHLFEISKKVNDKIFIVMRSYFEKPRTTNGWKGLINDPDLNESFNVNKGLYKAREFLIYLANIQMPSSYEILDSITPQYISDLISWGAIGARTTESQVHRQMVSGLSFPIGYKNGTTGNIEIAADGIISSQTPHCFMGITDQGTAAICKTRGTLDTHIILRGGKDKVNYFIEDVDKANEILKEKKIKTGIMIDCSHGNSGKDYRNQATVLDFIINNHFDKENHNYICGLMLESNLKEGKQSLPENVTRYCAEELIYNLKTGISITDSCIGIEETEKLIMKLYNCL